MLRSHPWSVLVVPVTVLIVAGAPGLEGAVPFESPREVPVGTMPLGIAVGDLDGDGKRDLVFGAYEDDRIVVYPNRSVPGSLMLGAPVLVGAGIHPQGIVIQDLDGDGKDDVAIANSGNGINTGTLTILRNTSVPGAIALTHALNLLLDTAHRVVSADFDGDGRPDLAATGNSAGVVALFRNTGPVGSIAFAQVGVLSGGSPLQPLAAADLDGDSRPEVIIPMPSAATMRIYPNTSSAGSIAFGPGIDFAMPPGPHGIGVADMNQDGKLDLVIANESGTVSVFANASNGPGDFSLGPRLDVPGRAGMHEMAVGDLDGDGRSDVTASAGPANVVVVFRNVSEAGQIALVKDQEVIAGPSPFGSAIADVDDDNSNDVLVTNFGWITAYIFRNAVPPIAAFLGFPVTAQCGGSPCTAHTADVSAVVDHAVRTGYNCSLLQTCDSVVLAFDHEKGDQLSNCAPPGYTNATASPFLTGVMNYVGATCRVSVPGLAPQHFLNYDGHSGYDFPYGSEFIVAAASGVLEVPVADPINNPSGSDPHTTYNSLRIRHPNGLETWYLHAVPGSECLAFRGSTCKAGSPARPNPGDSVPVNAGDWIGIVGSTGAQAPHLHFEVRQGTKVLDPYERQLWE